MRFIRFLIEQFAARQLPQAPHGELENEIITHFGQETNLRPDEAGVGKIAEREHFQKRRRVLDADIRAFVRRRALSIMAVVNIHDLSVVS